MRLGLMGQQGSAWVGAWDGTCFIWESGDLTVIQLNLPPTLLVTWVVHGIVHGCMGGGDVVHVMLCLPVNPNLIFIGTQPIRNGTTLYCCYFNMGSKERLGRISTFLHTILTYM